MPLPLLDPCETHARIPGPYPDLQLFLRRLRGAEPTAPAVLYVHGATFPSALSVAHRFGEGPAGRSWRDALAEAGLDVWAFDFLGFGGSDRYPEMAGPATGTSPLGAAETAAEQVVAVLRHIRERRGGGRVSLLAHSWGTMAAARAAGEAPELVDRLVLFGPIAPRAGSTDAPAPQPAWREVTLAQQYARFVEDVPAGERAVLDDAEFDAWGARWLESDPGSLTRSPPAVRLPAGPAVDIARAWRGEWRWDPARVRAPVTVLRGEWDGLTADADARVLLDAMVAAPHRRDVKLPCGTHLMHLESGRDALHAASIAALTG